MTVRVEDDNQVPQIIEELYKLQNKKIEIGVLGDQDSKLLMIASVNEFGIEIDVTPKMRAYLHSQGLHLKKSTKKVKIPERSFIRSTFDEEYKDMIRKAEAGIAKVVEGRQSADTFFALYGEYLVSLIQEKIVSIENPANHPFTVQQKTTSAGVGDSPLEDTGRLKGAISYRVV